MLIQPTLSDTQSNGEKFSDLKMLDPNKKGNITHEIHVHKMFAFYLHSLYLFCW